MMLLELLQRWAALEPDRCADVANDRAHVFLGEQRGWQILHLSDVLLESIIQGAVQRAIVHHNLRVLMMNASGPCWHIELVQFDKSEILWQTQTKAESEAIALLDAYVQWLEHRREVAA